ncbi:MAG: DNA polymerase I [Candidatus Pacebacteria bacterium]|jgi:DNA polymerase-1|nr:DNA polymerase I [Candidatus Paceibacterota bacterium]MDD5535118.1 DNA polymerase I [Candidatus Paceibacterota bacterium]
MKKIAIIDSYALAHRSYHALPPLTSPEGVLVNGVYGFMLIFLRMLKDLNPDYVLATFDMAAPTFRHKEYKEYKAKREKMPDNFYEQIQIIKNLLKEFGVPILEKEGYEADDIIGSVVETIKDKNVECVIVTGDLDTLQLVNEKVSVYTFRRGLQDRFIYDIEKVKERFEIEPEQLIDWKALRGDPSDNVPGVPSVGEKTAQELIKTFGTLDNLYQQLKEVESTKELSLNNKKAKISPRIFKKLKDFEEQAYFSRHLVLIEKNIPLDFTLKQAEFEIPDKEKLISLLGKLGFHSLVSKIFDSSEKKVVNQKKVSLKIINAISDLEKLNEKITQEKLIGIFLDTQGERWGERETKGLGISFLDDSLFYLPKKLFKDFFELKINWSKKTLISFETKTIFEEVEEFSSFLFEDIKIQAWLIDPDRKNYKINSLGKFFLRQEAEDSFENSLAKLIPLWKVIQEKMVSLELEGIWNKIEKPLIPVISLMERNGILVDQSCLNKLLKETTKEITSLEKQIYQLAGKEFNINSPQQLAMILFEELGISSKNLKKTSTKKISTNVNELLKITNDHSIVPLFIQYRKIEKLRNSFLEVLPGFINEKTQRIHAIWNQTGTATGRLSSEKPNLQNIPQKGDIGKQVRKTFISEKSCLLVSLDYSQIELRLAAHLSQDEKMIKIFSQDKDIHLATASYVHNIPEKEVTSEMRNQAKALNFGIIYGMGNKAFAETASISLKEAKIFREKYFSKFSGLKKYLDDVLDKAKRTGYVETLFGRKRYLPLLGGFGRTAKEQERIALNMPIQGLAADIIKMAMIRIQKLANEERFEEKVKILLQIHDELILEVKSEIINDISPCLKEAMENAAQLTVPLRADIRIGTTWGEMKKLDY